jgi:hypothetical protein
MDTAEFIMFLIGCLVGSFCAFIYGVSTTVDTAKDAYGEQYCKPRCNGGYEVVYQPDKPKAWSCICLVPVEG